VRAYTWLKRRPLTDPCRYEELRRSYFVESVALASAGREDIYSEEERDATFLIERKGVDGGDDAILRNGHHSLLARALSSRPWAGTDSNGPCLKLFAVERVFVRHAKTKRKDRTIRTTDMSASPNQAKRHTHKRVLHGKVHRAEQLRLSGFIVDRQLALTDVLGTLRAVCSKFGRLRPLHMLASLATDSA
jgi:hypothetical protein